MYFEDIPIIHVDWEWMYDKATKRDIDKKYEAFNIFIKSYQNIDKSIIKITENNIFFSNTNPYNTHKNIRKACIDIIKPIIMFMRENRIAFTPNKIKYYKFNKKNNQLSIGFYELDIKGTYILELNITKNEKEGVYKSKERKYQIDIEPK